ARLQARLYRAVADAPHVTLTDLVPPDAPPLREIIFEGKNSLPAFTLFQKRFCRPSTGRGELWGYNHQALAWLTGPGYFVVHDDLVALSHRIHAHPELGFEEERASGWLAETLDAAGFKVSRGICELPTAFVAEAGSGPLCVALCAEYDCLPGIGHACGHNVIAAMAAGAGIAAARVADDVGLTVRVIGTPAEEGGG